MPNGKMPNGTLLIPSKVIPRPLFLHFLDVHYFTERTNTRTLLKATAEAEMALRLSVILGSEILIPAASYYENSTARKILDQYREMEYCDCFYLVGSGNSLADFIEEKLPQYGPSTKIGASYRKKLHQPFPWRSRRRSSTADIKADWIAAPLGKDIIGDLTGNKSIGRRDLEADWVRLPERLEGTAFTPENAWKLMPSLHGNFVARRNLSAFVNNAYFSSYLKDVRAGIFQRMPWLSGGLEIQSHHRDLDIDFASLLNVLRDSKVLDNLRSFSLCDIRRFRDDEKFVAAFAATQGTPSHAHHDINQLGKTQSESDARVKIPAMAHAILPKDYIVTAARQELLAIREILTELNIKRIDGYNLGNRRLEIFNLATSANGNIPVGLMMPIEKGKSQMKALLDAIAHHAKPLHIIMVGMMAGVKGKVNLLDVVAPRSVYDLTAIGTKDGRHIGEPEAGTMDAKMHQWVSSIDIPPDYPTGFRLIPHKKTVAVSAKIDDISHDLARAALAVDPENVVGLEMEVAALTEQQSTQSLNGQSVGHLMVKGVADYAGDLPDISEVTMLKELLQLSEPTENMDPTRSPIFKATLQREATRRALRLTLDLMKVLPRNV